MDWTEHWGLTRDPFTQDSGSYVPLPGHEEAVARLVHTIEAGHRLALLTAPAGMGKTLVLRRALAEARDPGRRLALATSPIDGAQLYSRLAVKLGARGYNPANKGAAWLALDREIRTCALQGFHVVLAVDECQTMMEDGAVDDLRRLVQIGASAGCRVTVMLVLGEESREEVQFLLPWMLDIRLKSLTCSEAERYLTARLAAAGCQETVFSQRSVSRLHLHSGGTPSGLNRLASLCLMAGAYRGLEAISSDLVEGVLREFRPAIEPAL